MNHPHTAFSGARARGFTLFELMIVLSIAAIMAAMAVPGMRSFLQTQQQISAVSNLITNLNYARSEAIKEDVPVTGANCTGTGVCVCASANGTTCDPAGNWNNGWIVYTSATATALETTGPLQSGLTLSASPAAAAVTFLPNGMTNTGALTEFVLCDSRGASYAREVEVDVTGRIQASSTRASMSPVPRRWYALECFGSGSRLRGFTLIELLVALVILSVGLLGIAKLSLGTVQSNDSAMMRSQATAMVQQIIDNMRANEPQATAGAYNIAIGSSPGPAPACYAVACGAATIVTYDLAKWKALLGTNLPSGDGSINTATANNPLTGGTETTAIITVQWDDSVAMQSFGETAGTKSLTVETLL